MKFLLTNDDGIQAKGLQKLAEMAVQLGDVIIIAPDHECSAMSQRITLREPLTLRTVAYPIPGVKAYSLHGTPADCIKVGLSYLNLKPDYVFSGMNHGYNCGFDIAYSGTVSATFEAAMNGIPAIAFSNEMYGSYEVADRYMLDLTQLLIAKAPLKNAIWNINFPGCSAEQCQGYLLDQVVARVQYYQDHYSSTTLADGSIELSCAGIPMELEQIPEGTDLWAVLHNYVSVGQVNCDVLN